VNRFAYDLVVVGAGSGGYAAARTAHDLGASVALVDHGPLGGLCILKGCMPSKTLIATSDLVREIQDGHELGVRASHVEVDLPAVMARKRDVIKGFADYRIEGLSAFPLYEGRARFLSPREVAVGDDVVLEGRSFVIATGSVVAPPMLEGLGETGSITSDEALDRSEAPKSMIVLGGGYVGAELGQFYSRIGVKTTMLIRSNQLLTMEDGDVGAALTLYFRREGIAIETKTRLLRAFRRGDRKVVEYHQNGETKEIEAEEIFNALGRVPNIEGLDLEKAGVEAHVMTGIGVGLDLRTSAPHVFAVGDVMGGYALVHIAIYQGEIAARNAVLGERQEADYSLIDVHTTFTDPQVAIVGRTEKQLEAAGTPYLKASYLFSDLGKAIAINKTKGFVKMMAAPETGKILGAAIVGAQASDLIHEIIVGMHYGATVRDFLKIPHLHPTLAEILTYPPEEIVSQMDETPALTAAPTEMATATA